MSPARYWPLEDRLDLDLQPGGQRAGDLETVARTPGAEVDRVPGRRARTRARSTIPRTMSLTWMKSRDCAAVLEDDRGPAVEQPRGEDRRHAGVRVGERLAGAVGVEEAQRHRGDAVGGPGDQGQLLVVALGDGVDRGGDQRLDLARYRRAELSAAGGAAGLPLARQQLLLAGAAAPTCGRARRTRTRPLP